MIVRRLAAAFTLGALVATCAFAPPAAGQKAARPAPPDAAALRRAFDDACAAELELVRDEFAQNDSEHTGGRYWLAHVRPKRAGTYALRYRYKHSDPMYTHGVRTLGFTVGPRGCRRKPDAPGAYICLGDTLILPVALDGHSAHTFTLTRGTYDAGLWETPPYTEPDERLELSPVANPAAPYLRYVGRSVYNSPHRALGYTLTFSATFEAVRPGRLNLALASRAPGETEQPAPKAGGTPVLIVAPGTPLTVLAYHEDVEQLDGDPPRFSSHYGGGFQTNLIVLQPGDRVTLPYCTITQRGRDLNYDGATTEAAALAAVRQRIAPVIAALPFAIDPAFSFNQWLIKYLPPDDKPPAK
ncbi:MAG TPA: hypothetical protein VF546_08230 [Pyrinomonadaceae bacterium]